MKCATEDDYTDHKSKIEQEWSQEFKNYFDRHLHQTILNNSGRWVLEKLGIYNPYSGITSNPAESINNMIKAIQHRKELPVDLICLNLLMCQKSVYADIQCGRAGFGNFKLRKDCEYARLDRSEINVHRMIF